MRAFNIGDTVTLESEEDTLYIITAVAQYEIMKDGKPKTIFDYELVQILPVTSKMKFAVETEDRLHLYSKYRAIMWKTMMEYVTKDRRKNNLFGEPEFLELVRINKEQSEMPTVKKNGLQSGGKQLSITTNMDANVFYDRVHSVDEALDRINDLNLLITLFDKDEGENSQEILDEYIKHKNTVTERLKRILFMQG